MARPGSSVCEQDDDAYDSVITYYSRALDDAWTRLALRAGMASEQVQGPADQGRGRGRRGRSPRGCWEQGGVTDVELFLAVARVVRDE